MSKLLKFTQQLSGEAKIWMYFIHKVLFLVIDECLLKNIRYIFKETASFDIYRIILRDIEFLNTT